MPKINKKIEKPKIPLKQEVIKKTNVTEEDSKNTGDGNLNRVIATANNIQKLGSFLYNHIAEKIRPIAIDINPEDDPETAVAIRRIFGNEAPMQITGDMFLQLLDYNEAIEELEIEQSEDNVSWEDVTGEELDC